MRRDDGVHDVLAGAEPAQHLLQQRHRVPQRIDAENAGVDLQPVARAFHRLGLGQVADGAVEKVEDLAGLHRYLDLPALAVGKRAGGDAAVDQAHAADVRRCGGVHKEHQHQPDQEDAGHAAMANGRPDREREDEQEQPREGQADEEEKTGHGRGRDWRWTVPE